MPVISVGIRFLRVTCPSTPICQTSSRAALTDCLHSSLGTSARGLAVSPIAVPFCMNSSLMGMAASESGALPIGRDVTAKTLTERNTPPFRRTTPCQSRLQFPQPLPPPRSKASSAPITSPATINTSFGLLNVGPALIFPLMPPRLRPGGRRCRAHVHQIQLTRRPRPDGVALRFGRKILL